METTVAALYVLWAVAWATTWSLTIFKAVYLNTPLSTIVRVATAASEMTQHQATDAIMTAGAIFLPDIVLMLALVAAINAACIITVLVECYSPDDGDATRNHRKRRRSSHIQQWIVRRTADMASWCGAMVEEAITSMTIQRRPFRWKRCMSGNSAH
jgi:hypothetical protein